MPGECPEARLASGVRPHHHRCARMRKPARGAGAPLEQGAAGVRECHPSTARRVEQVEGLRDRCVRESRVTAYRTASEMGRAGIEPATLGLKVDAAGFACSRVNSRHAMAHAIGCSCGILLTLRCPASSSTQATPLGVERVHPSSRRPPPHHVAWWQTLAPVGKGSGRFKRAFEPFTPRSFASGCDRWAP
jgi:hypothetical protein